jgi:hypothetical protein
MRYYILEIDGKYEIVGAKGFIPRGSLGLSPINRETSEQETDGSVIGRKADGTFYRVPALVTAAINRAADDRVRGDIERLKFSIEGKHDHIVGKGAAHLGKTFRCDGKARAALDQLISYYDWANLPEGPIEWTTRDRESHIVLDTKEKALDLMRSMMSRVVPIKQVRETHFKNCTSPSYNYSEGWPK